MSHVQQQAAETADRPRILVVDDTEDNLFLMTAVLEDTYELSLATCGADALRMAGEGEPPDLILLDIMMPDMDGYEVLRRLREDAATHDIPVIFLTALTSPEEEQHGLDLGAADYIHKPISPPLVLARVKSQLERSAGAKKLKALSRKLSRYLAPQVCQALLDGTQDAEIRTQRKKLTVFFSDIKDFTASTARWQPEEITILLNSYFSEMSRIADEYGGTVDKFIGDAMVIFFGDPHSRGAREDALQCVKMARAMQQRMAELQILWAASGGPDRSFQIRVGINTGYCNVGNFGSERRMDYTIIGPEVNLAARLEQAAEPGGILVSASTWALVKDEVEADARESVTAKGFAQPIEAWSVRLDTGVRDSMRKVFQRERPGLRVMIDLDRLTVADRAAAALELREMADHLH